MNENTRVAVCCYAGDQQQVTSALEMYLHHQCPFTIFSPDDAKVDIPNIDCRFAGRQAYTGQDSLDRQWKHLKMLLTYPEDFFLIHDSDSLCLSAQLPEYLYREDVLWSNVIVDKMRERDRGFYMDGFPRLAFQPPYFVSREVLTRLLEPVKDNNLAANPTLPFIDHYMVQIAVRAGVAWKNFHDGFTGPISGDPRTFAEAWNKVQGGAVMVHSVKAPQFWRPLLAAHGRRLSGQAHIAAPPMPTPMRWSEEQVRTRSRQMRDERDIALRRAPS